MQHVETVIIGAGQTGLATSYWLQQAGREHLVLDQAAMPASAWRTGRWDSFTLVTPNWTVNMPGAQYDIPDRDGFMPLPGIIDYFDRYVELHQPPVQYNSRVDAVRPFDGGGYQLDAGGGQIRAENVVIATGFEQLPGIPATAGGISPEILQIHSSQYRNPEALPPGAVMVVGSAQSGAQIAEELNHRGREVYLSVSGAGRARRRYRGKDGFEWLWQIGFFDLPPEKFPGDATRFVPPHLTGIDGGHTLNLHQFARDGVHLLGHVREAAGTTVRLAPDLYESLAKGDGFEKSMTQMIDGYIQVAGIDAPPEETQDLRDGFEQPLRESLDLRESGIGSIVWATGYRHDDSMIELPVTDERGFLIGDRGISQYPGLYFAGMIWMPGIKPVTLGGVSESARHIVDAIVARQRTPVIA
ncbi:MAG: NAD(P)-binding domain-containing protein [Thermomicrobiales bacterium]